MGSRAPRHRAPRGSSGLSNALQAVGVAGGALAAVAVLTVVAGGGARIQGPTVGDPTSVTTSPARPLTSSGSGGSTPTQRIVPGPVRSLPQAPGTTAPPPYAPAARPAIVPPTQFTRTSTSPPGPTSAPTPAPTATETPPPTPTPTPTPTKVHPTRPVTPGIPPTSSPSPSPTG